MRVCYVSHASTLTGANRSLVDIVSRIGDLGVSPVVIVRNDGPLIPELEKHGIEQYRASYNLTIANSDGKWWRDCVKNAAYGPSARRIARLMRRMRVDIVHNNSLMFDGGMAAAQMASLPYVCHIREFMQEDHGFQFLDEERTRKLSARSNHAIAISESIAKKFKNWFSDGQLSAIPNGFDTERYRIEHGTLLQDPVCHLLLAGSISAGKGQLDAVKATEELLRRGRNVHLTLAGSPRQDGSYERECLEYVAQHAIGENVSFLGFVHDLTQLKQKADISLTCSRFEALGRVTIEGMLAGCLVIGANSGATPEIVEDKVSGLLYRTGDYRDLADKIEWALDNVEQTRAMAAAGQAYAVERYDVKAYVEKLAAIYRSIYSNE